MRRVMRLASLLVLLGAQMSCSKGRGLVHALDGGGTVDLNEAGSEGPAAPTDVSLPDVSPPDVPLGGDHVEAGSDGGPLDADDRPAIDAAKAADALAVDGQADACLPVTCASAAGDYCGIIGDGCGDNLDCGECRAGWSCQDHICQSEMDCWPAPYGVIYFCQPPSVDVEMCGRVWTSCRNSILECPTTCTKPGWVCDNGHCKGSPEVCTKLACRPAGSGQYCGSIGDGCGGALQCGECADGSECGAVTSGVCGANEQGLVAPWDGIFLNGEGPAPPPPPPARSPR
jgi:hypothetical protein